MCLTGQQGNPALLQWGKSHSSYWNSSLQTDSTFRGRTRVQGRCCAGNESNKGWFWSSSIRSTAVESVQSFSVGASWSVTFFFFDVSIDERLPSALIDAQLVASSLHCLRLQTSFPSDEKPPWFSYRKMFALRFFFFFFNGTQTHCGSAWITQEKYLTLKYWYIQYSTFFVNMGWCQRGIWGFSNPGLYVYIL